MEKQQQNTGELSADFSEQGRISQDNSELVKSFNKKRSSPEAEPSISSSKRSKNSGAENASALSEDFGKQCDISEDSSAFVHLPNQCPSPEEEPSSEKSENSGVITLGKFLARQPKDDSITKKIMELHDAVEKGDYQRVEHLLQQYSQGDASYVKAVGKGGQSAFHLATSRKMSDIAGILLQFGADINAQNTKSKGDTALHTAIWAADIEMTKWLLSKGAAVDIQNYDGNAPLHIAIQAKNTKIAETLLQFGANIDAQDKNSDTALHTAIRAGDIEMTEWLLSKGADVNAQNCDGNAPLHITIQEKNIEIVRLLVREKADVNALNKINQNSLHLASSCFIVHTEEAIKFLMEAGAVPTLCNKWGSNTLHPDVCNQCVVLMKEQLESGIVDVDARNFWMETPLHVFVAEGDQQGIELALRKGAKLSYIDKKRATPLLIAVKNLTGATAEDIVDTLLPYCSEMDITRPEKSGHNALYYATKKYAGRSNFSLTFKLYNKLVGQDPQATELHGWPGTRFLKRTATKRRRFNPIFWYLRFVVAAKDGVPAIRAFLNNKNNQIALQWVIKGDYNYDYCIKNKDNLAHYLMSIEYKNYERMVQVLKFTERRWEADFNARNRDKENSVHVAVRCNNTLGVQFLIDRKDIEPDFPNKDGHTPFDLAVILNKPEILKLLYDSRRIVPNRKDNSGKTALQLAIEHDSLEAAEYLLTECGYAADDLQNTEWLRTCLKSVRRACGA